MYLNTFNTYLLHELLNSCTLIAYGSYIFLTYLSTHPANVQSVWHSDISGIINNNGDVVALQVLLSVLTVCVVGTCHLSVSVRLRPNSFYVLSPNRIVISASYRSAVGKVTVVRATLHWQDDAEKTESRPITAASAASGNLKKKIHRGRKQLHVEKIAAWRREKEQD